MTDHGLFDIHCHLIQGVDDGAQDLEETRKLLRMEYEQGVRNIIATPHYRDQMFDTPIHTIRSQFALVEKCVQEFNQELAKEDRMRIYLGCEFHANMQLSRILRKCRIQLHRRPPPQPYHRRLPPHHCTCRTLRQHLG